MTLSTIALCVGRITILALGGHFSASWNSSSYGAMKNSLLYDILSSILLIVEAILYLY
jgi:hypothetical protein